MIHIFGINFNLVKNVMMGCTVERYAALLHVVLRDMVSGVI